MPTLAKDWDRHVISAEEVARRPGFQALRESILARAEIAPGERVVDIGSGTGLLTLPAARRAERVIALDISPGIAVWAASRIEVTERSSLDLDPVCRMAVERSRAGAEREFGGEDFRFCSQRCAERFDRAPRDYLASLAAGSVRSGETPPR